MFKNKSKELELVLNYHEAILQNNIEQVKEYIDHKDSPAGLIDSEMQNISPIMYCALEGFWDLVLKLFEREASLDVKSEPFNWYLLHECLVNGPDKVFKNVVHYADYTVKTKDGRNSLMIAIEKEKFERAQYLIDNSKFIISDKDKNKRTVLHYAALKNNKELFLELVKKGSNIFEEDKDKKNPMDLLTDEIFRNSLPTILEKMKINLVENQPLNAEIQEINNITEEKNLNTIQSIAINKDKITSLGKLIKKK